jgi:ketosteroid isomerase-like protein
LAIVEASEAYRKAVLEGDAAQVAAFYRNDAMEMPPFQRAITGRAAIEQFCRGMFKGPMRVTGFIFKHSETTADGDIGYDVGTYRRTMEVRADWLRRWAPL